LFLSFIVEFLSGLAFAWVRPGKGKLAAVENGCKKMPENENRYDIIREAVGGVLKKIQDGSAPEEIIALYENMTPEQFGFWLHGFYSGYSKKLEGRSAEACRFLKKVLANYEEDLKNGFYLRNIEH